MNTRNRVRIRSAFGRTRHYRAKGLQLALPAQIAVHRVVAPADTRKLANAIFLKRLLQLFEITRATRRQSVATIHERVHIHALQLLLRRHFKQRMQMPLL